MPRINYDEILDYLDRQIKDEQKAGKEYRMLSEIMRHQGVQEGRGEIDAITRDETSHLAKLRDIRHRIALMKETAE